MKQANINRTQRAASKAIWCSCDIRGPGFPDAVMEGVFRPLLIKIGTLASWAISQEHAAVLRAQLVADQDKSDAEREDLVSRLFEIIFNACADAERASKEKQA